MILAELTRSCAMAIRRAKQKAHDEGTEAPFLVMIYRGVTPVAAISVWGELRALTGLVATTACSGFDADILVIGSEFVQAETEINPRSGQAWVASDTWNVLRDPGAYGEAVALVIGAQGVNRAGDTYFSSRHYSIQDGELVFGQPFEQDSSPGQLVSDGLRDIMAQSTLTQMAYGVAMDREEQDVGTVEFLTMLHGAENLTITLAAPREDSGRVTRLQQLMGEEGEIL